jgi:hypothetical protein
VLEIWLVVLLWLVKGLTCSLVVTLDQSEWGGSGELKPLFSSALPCLQEDPARLAPVVAPGTGRCCGTRERR